MSEATGLILVIDDHDDSREMVSALLELSGYSTHSAANGVEALAALRGGLRPGLIILDWLMPGMDGATFMDELHRTPELASIPVIVVSANVALHTNHPGTHVLVKPVLPDVLLERVAALCGTEAGAGGKAP